MDKVKPQHIAHVKQNPDGSWGTTAIRRFKARLAGAKRRTQFIYGWETAAFAGELRAALMDLKEALIDPRKGVELVADFFRSDEVFFNMCDDSDGALGQVFKFDARELFVHFASACNEKAWLANLILQLQHNGDYGVRDCLFDVAAQYLPKSVMRELVEKLWTLAHAEPTPYRQRGWLFLIESLARQLHDPKLFEKASRATTHEIYPAQCIDIAEVYFESGDAATALSWINRIPLDEGFEADRRDDLLLAVYKKLRNRKAAAETAWRMFRRCRSEETFEQLLKIVGTEKRQQILDEEANLILQSPGISLTDAEFLIWCGKMDEAETYLLTRAAELDGSDYFSILPLAEAMEREERFLAATVLYRALLESILARAISKYYGFGVRYLRKLDVLAPLVKHWRTFTPHQEYFLQLLDDHARKWSFWERYEAKARRQTRRSKKNLEDLE
jgi:hypothetical protein